MAAIYSIFPAIARARDFFMKAWTGSSELILPFLIKQDNNWKIVVMQYNMSQKTNIDNRGSRLPRFTSLWSGLSRKVINVIGMDNLITGDLRNIEHLFKLRSSLNFIIMM